VLSGLDFLSYLRGTGVIDARQAQVLSDEAGLKKTSVFEYLTRHETIGGLNFSFEQLVDLLFAYGKEAGIDYTLVTVTKGYVCDTDLYTALGGVNESIVKFLLPIKQADGTGCIALTTKPDDEVTLASLAKGYGPRQFSVGICTNDLWDRLYTMYVEPLLLNKMADQLSASNVDTGVQRSAASDSAARRFYRMVMNAGIERNASDVHFLPCSKTCQVLYRIDGDNHFFMDIPLDILEKICNILKTDGHISNKSPREAIDGKVRYSPSEGEVPGDEIDLRVSIIPTKRGSDLNVRYLSSQRRTFDELGISEDNIKIFKQLLDLPSGMIVQVGPTGSGKSTTLYAGLEYIHASLRNVLTAEDPVEILMDGISQIDVDSSQDGKFGFSDALKASLRHDPDVVVVGELRDLDTAELAVRASNTGHLVLTSLHTNDSIGAFERLINMGVDPYSLGEVIVAVMGQRLVKRLCPYCKEEYELDLRSDIARFYHLPERDGTLKFWRATGCVHCNNTGYHGRTAINEILLVDSQIRDYIQRHAVRLKFEELLRERKFVTMYQDGLKKAMAGITSLEELRKFAADFIAFKG